MKTFKKLLDLLDACDAAKEWAGEKTIEQAVSDCHRGDWLLWLAKKVGMDLKTITRAKAHCALTVRHLMKDSRSIKACEVALKFADGQATKEELRDAAADAAAAAYAAAAAAAAAYAAYAARNKNRMETADICRKYIGDELIRLVNKKLK